MPLFIDDEQVNPKDFAAKIGIKSDQYDRIIKKPSFRLDASQVVKNKTIKSNLAERPVRGIKASFWFTDKSDGMVKRLRYAQSRAPKVEGGVRTWTYDPAYVNVKGNTVAFQGDESKAFYMFLRPENPLSPFFGKKKGFTFIDPVAETLKKSENMSNIQKALSHATNVEEEELVLIAKGLKILTSDDYEIDELRLRMQEYAINPVTNKKYVSGMEDEMVRIEGRISNLVDKKMIVLEKRGNARQWVWASGPKEGQSIGEYIVNPNDDAKQRLFTAIKHNLGDYLSDLKNSTVLIQADRKAREVLAASKSEVPTHLTEVNSGGSDNQGQTSLKEVVTDFQSAKAFVESKGYPKTPGMVKQLENAVVEGHVDYGNVDAFLTTLYAK